jgi:hypothetical protein
MRTSNGQLRYMDNFRLLKAKVAGGAQHIYAGTLVSRNGDGYLVPSGTGGGNEIFAGVAVFELNQAEDAEDGDNELLIVPAQSGKIVKMKCVGVTLAMINTQVGIVDNDTVMDLGFVIVAVGVIVNIADEENYCWVKI